MMMRKSGSGRKNGGELKQRNKKSSSCVNTKTNKRMRKKESSETGYTNNHHKTSTSSITSTNSTIATAAASSDISGLTSSLTKSSSSSSSSSRMRSLAGNRGNTSSSTFNGISATANKIGKNKNTDNRQSSVTDKPLKNLGTKVKQDSVLNLYCDGNDDNQKQDKNFVSEKSLRSRTIISTNVSNASFFLASSVAQSPTSPSSFSFSPIPKMNSVHSNSKSSGDRRSKAVSTAVMSPCRPNKRRISSSSSIHSISTKTTPNASVFLTDNHGISSSASCLINPRVDLSKSVVNGSSRSSSENLISSTSSSNKKFSTETQTASNQPSSSSTTKPTSQIASKKSSNVDSTPLASSKSTNTLTKGESKPNNSPVKKIKGKGTSTNKNKPISIKKTPVKPKQSNKKTDQKKVKKAKCNAHVKKEPQNQKGSIDGDGFNNQIRRRGQRMASLNAICKVHLLFESERDLPIVNSNSVVSPTPPPTPPRSIKVEAKGNNKSNKPDRKKTPTVGDKSRKNSESKKESAKQSNFGKRAKNNTNKSFASKGNELVLHNPSARQVAIPRKRKLIDEDIEIIDTRSCKRMASLNASAILAASSLPERRIVKRCRSVESTRSTESTVEMIHETKISSNSRVQVPQSGGNTCTANQLVVESAQTIELIKKVRRSSGKIRERLLAIEMMEREYDMVDKDLKEAGIANGRIKSGLEKVTAKSVKKCRRSIQSTTTTREATTGLRQTTEYQVTKVQINTSKATDLSSEREKTAHQIETILNEDAIVQKYHIHHQTKATSQSYRVQMETSSFHPSSNPSTNLLASTHAVHTVPCLPLHSSSAGQTVGDLHLTNGANLLQNSPLLTTTNQGLDHNAAAAAAAAACFSYSNQPSIVQLACNQPYRALTSSNSPINQINPIPVLNIGPQYPSHYASAFSVPHHSNHATSINYPTESYGFYQHNGPIIQPIHDPYIRAYSLHKPIPYHASQMAHHSDQTYREFNPIKQSSYQLQPQYPPHTPLIPQQHSSLSASHRHPIHVSTAPPLPHPSQFTMQQVPSTSQLPPPHPPPPTSMSSHHPLPMSGPPLPSQHQPSSQPQSQLPPQSLQSAPGTSRFETNSFSSKAISYDQPSYYILQYPNNDISCSLRANNMYHNLSSTNDQITIHQAPHHESQHLSVNIAGNNLTTFMTRDSIATAQNVQTNSVYPSNLQPVSTPSTSNSFSSSNISTGGPSIAFLGSTSILPGHIAPSMFQALSSSTTNSIINSELPQGLSPVPGPAPVAVATPVSVENLTSLSTASPATMSNEISSLSSTSISTQVDMSTTVNTNNSRSSTYGSSSSAANHSHVATISPLVTSSTNRFSKSVSCSTNTEPESRRSLHHHHHQQQIQQQSLSTPSTSQSTITITPVHVNSYGNNYTSVNNVCNITTVSSNNGNNTNSSNNCNGSGRQKAITPSLSNFLKDSSVNTPSSGKDSSTTNMANRKTQRKQLENKDAPVLNKQKNQANKVRYPQSHKLASTNSSSSSAVVTSTPTPPTISISTSTSPSNLNTSTLPTPTTTSTSVSTVSNPTLSTSSSLSPPNQQLAVVNNNRKVISSNNQSNGQYNSSKKRPNKSNKNLIDNNLVNEVPRTTISPSIELGPSRKTGKKRLFHGWSWRGNPSKKPVFIKPDESPQLRDCYPAICHIQGDVIKVRDSVLLRGGPRKIDLHFVAKICALWEAPETGEMMMSLLWYYRPEHTEPGRKPCDQLDEIFASKHQDVNSVACIDDKCYVLTFNEYCRYRKRQKMESENINISLTDSLVPTGKDYNRRSRLPRRKVFPDRVFFCRKVYDFRLGRALKNPATPAITDISAWRR